MAGQDTEAMRGLLGRQLASISDTLAKASQRRDAEIQKRTVSAKQSSAPAVQSPDPSRTDPSLTSDTEGGQSDSVESVNSRSRQAVSTYFNFVNNSDTDLLTFRDSLGDAAPSPLRKESLSREDNKHMRARFNHPSTMANAYDDRSSRLTAAEYAHDLLSANSKGPPSSMSMSVDMARSEFVGASFSLPNDIDIDPKKALAEFDWALSAGETTVRNDADEVDPKRLLAMFPGKLAGADEITEDDSKQMLAEIEGRAAVAPQHGEIGGHEHHRPKYYGREVYISGSQSSFDDLPMLPSVVSQPPPVAQIAGRVESFETPAWQAASDEFPKDSVMSTAQATSALPTESGGTIDEAKAMLAEFEKNTPSIDHRPAEDEEDSIDALYSRLTNMLAPVIGSEDPETDIEDAQSERMSGDKKFEIGVEEPVKPYVIALLLEMGGCDWEYVMGWTTYLFSKGPNGHEARREKQKALDQASAELDVIIEHTLQEEARFAQAEEKDRVRRRLIVSNVATDAVEEDLKEFFYQSGFDLENVKVLPIQDPIKRTKVAHVDMFTRKDAIHASFKTGHIFGLILNIELAVEEEEG
ncbi:hypothetical protein FB567DRAFT_534532 [Paraphoma chrysanthemicola]|uniref:RRM domain-containing protein n=1 Tax=Paraphoma chrysanthemicola TaxID=798071 RepID=A0A8K0VV22_9PLEO|nr:hypothetical protein FB567DRAFT_534532 [Paraphoma chrysanthemicola]